MYAPRSRAPGFPSTGGRSRSRRVLAAVVAASLVALVAGSLAPVPASAAGSCGTQEGSWRTIPAPTFPAGPQRITAFAVTPHFPDRMFVTNGVAVMRSSDDDDRSGCEWDEVYSLDGPPTADAPYSSETATVVSIVMSEHRQAQERVVLVIREAAAGAARAHVSVSNDRGESWEMGDAGLPPAGEPEFVVAAPSDPGLLLLGLDAPSAGDLNSIDFLYASTDGGRSWTLRSSAEHSLARGILGVAVDPVDASVVWAWGRQGLYRSETGGRAFAPVPDFVDRHVDPVDVFHAPGEPPRLAVFVPGDTDVYLSGDGGASFLRTGTPGVVRSAVHGNVASSLAIATDDKVFAFARGTYGWFDLEAPNRGIRNLVMDRLPVPGLYGHTDGALYSFSPQLGSDVDAPDVVSGVDLSFRPPPPIPKKTAKLSPGDRRMVLDPGTSRTVTYTLDLPEPRTKLDVYFLIDTSDSMEKFLRGLLIGLGQVVQGLVDRGIDAEFGVGHYRAYPDLQSTNESDNYVYRRALDLAPISPELAEAISGLDADAGGIYDAHLGALYQTATGAGQDVFPEGPGPGDVPQGIQANFRAEALRVVIHATDEKFGRESNGANRPIKTPPPDIPDFDVVAQALARKDIRQVGISITKDPQADLTRMAKATGARAPTGGVDCDGDGTRDLAGGDELVCVMGLGQLNQAGTLVPPIVNLVEAVRARETVSLRVSGDDEVVSKVAPSTYTGVVIQNSKTLSFDVTYRCTDAMAGERFRVDLAAHSTELLDGAAATVRCRDLPEEVLPAALAAAQLVGVVAVPPAPPPPPAPELASQAQSQAQAHAAAAAAHQKQQQPQLAVAMASTEKAAEAEYAMTTYRRPEPLPSTAFLGGAAVLMSLAYAFASLARQKVAVERIRRR